MEIFQTIWNSLTTENEVLINIISIPFSFIEAYLYMLIFLTVLKIPYNKKQQFIFVLLFSLFSILNIFIIPTPYNNFINIIVCPVLVFLIFKTNILKSILSLLIMYLSSIIISTILIIIYCKIGNIPSSYVTFIPIHRIFYSLLSYFFIIFIYLMIRFFNIRFLFSDIANKKKNNYLLLNISVGVIAIALQAFLEYLYIDYIPTYIVILNLLVLLVYFFINLYTLIRTSKLEITTEKLKEEQLHNKTLTVLYDNIRGFKHDFNNIVQGIGGYIATDNIDGLKEYYSQVLDDCQKVNNLTILSPEIINNPAIYNLLSSKYYLAVELGIKMNLEIFMDLSNINMKIYELVRILGILIDNAIEAAKQCEEKEINVIIRKDNKLNKQLFIIENTYINKEVDIDKIFEKGHTSKQNEDSKSHGLGLWEIRQLVKKNSNIIDLYTTKNEKYFKQQFEVFCKK